MLLPKITPRPHTSRWGSVTPDPPPPPSKAASRSETDKQRAAKAKHARHRNFTASADLIERLNAYLATGNINFSAWMCELLEADLSRRGFGAERQK